MNRNFSIPMNITKLIIALMMLLPQFTLAQEYLIKEPNSKAETFSSWANQCDTDPNTNQKICYSSQTILIKEKDAEILYIAIGHIPESDKPLLRMTTPLGTLLPEGMQIQVDKGEQSRLPYIFCNRIGCHIEVGVTDKFLTAIKKGSTLKIRFLDLAGREFMVPVSLSGFTKAYNALEKS